jgi:hypothetical protein
VSLTGLRTDAGALRTTGTHAREVRRGDVTESGVIDLRTGRELADQRSGTSTSDLRGRTRSGGW